MLTTPLRRSPRGQLIRLLEDWSPPFPGMFLYYPSRRQVPTPLRVFIEYLQAELARTTSESRA